MSTIVAHAPTPAPPPSIPSDQLARALTDTELAVLRLVALGRSDRQIAQHLHLSEGAMKNRVGAMFAKLGVTGLPSARAAAVMVACRAGLLDVELGVQRPARTPTAPPPGQPRRPRPGLSDEAVTLAVRDDDALALTRAIWPELAGTAGEIPAQRRAMSGLVRLAALETVHPRPAVTR